VSRAARSLSVLRELLGYRLALRSALRVILAAPRIVRIVRGGGECSVDRLDEERE
jgi:hypothetical protein